ncbi:hypothetical protein OG900_31970 [Streptomyces sp. NBC_00433]
MDSARGLEAWIGTLPPDDPRIPAARARLGSTLRRLWLAGLVPDGLERATTVLREAVADTSRDHPDRALCLLNYSNVLITRRSADDLDSAVAALFEAVELTGSGSVLFPTCLATLGTALAGRSRARNDPADLDLAVDILERAVVAAGPNDPRPEFLANLAEALRGLSTARWSAVDNARAVEAAREAVGTAKPGSQRWPAIAAILGGALVDRARLTGEAGPLDESIGWFDAAIRATPLGSPELPQRLCHLGNALTDRAIAARDPTAFGKALELLETALSQTSRSDRTRALIHSNLAVRMTHWAETDSTAGSILDQALVHAERALESTEAADSQRSDRLTNLAEILRMSSVRTGDPDLLDRAAEAAQEAMEIQGQGNPRSVGALAAWGLILQARYLLTSRGTDLSKSIGAMAAAVNLTVPPEHPEHARRLSNLANVLVLRGLRNRWVPDLDNAVRALRTVVGRHDFSAAERAGHLTNLGAALQSRAQIRDDPDGLDEAVESHAEAVDLSGANSIFSSRYLSNLGNAVLMRAEFRHDPDGIVDAVAIQRRALDALPDGHANRTSVLGNLANAHVAAYEASGVREDLLAAIETTEEISADAATNPQDRMIAAWRLGDLSVRASGDTGAAFPALSLAIELAERAAWIGLVPSDRDTALIRFNSLPSDAAAAALAVGDLDVATTMLEAGRGVRWRDQLWTAQLDSLDHSEPDLAARLRALGRELSR